MSKYARADSVRLGGGGGVESCWRPYSAEFYTLFVTRFRTYKLFTHPKTKIYEWRGPQTDNWLPKSKSFSRSLLRWRVRSTNKMVNMATVCLHHKAHIYIEYHRVCLLVGIGTLPPPLSPASMPLPPEPGGWAHSPAGEGLGESQFRRLEKSLALCGLHIQYTN